LETAGTAPCVLNAANEIAVDRFLSGDIKFSYIPTLINKTLEKIENHKSPDVDTIFEYDRLARDLAVKL
jgi:1-deoxy-D-xylulose-5-phosphate reductoisomerase